MKFNSQYGNYNARYGNAQYAALGGTTYANSETETVTGDDSLVSFDLTVTPPLRTFIVNTENRTFS